MLGVGWVFAGAGSLLAIATGVAVVALRLIERLAIGRSKAGLLSGSADRSCGLVSVRTVLGVFVLVMIAGPLAGATVDIQRSLSNIPSFSGLEAGFIALLVVLAILAAIFEDGQ